MKPTDAWFRAWCHNAIPSPGVFRWTFNLRSRTVGRELQAENGKNERLEEYSIIFYHKNLRII